MTIFMVQGTVVGVIGIVIGLILGIVIASNVTDIVNCIQSLLGLSFLSSSIYT